MNILETIIESKKKEIEARHASVSIAQLRARPAYSRPAISLKQALLKESSTGIIAEFKRKSPSKGIIHAKADVAAVTAAYARYGAAGLSILTDEPFFGGSAKDLELARTNALPVLRKDFVIDSYQVEESRAMGADLILLIAACLDPGKLRQLAVHAKDLGMEVLLEIHNKEELEHICDEIDIVGVNNRDLKTFSVDLNLSIELGAQIPQGKVRIAESGIRDAATVHKLRQHGFRGFLMGENFMKEPDPAIAFASFVQELKKHPHEGESLRHDATRTGNEAG